LVLLYYFTYIDDARSNTNQARRHFFPPYARHELIWRVVEVLLHPFLTTAVSGGEWSASLSGCVTPEERNSGYWVSTRGLSGRSRRKAKSLTETIHIFIIRQHTVYYIVKYATGMRLDINIRATKRYVQKYTRKSTFCGIIGYISIHNLIMKTQL